ncbi:MAG: hypothetical protein QF732_12995 [Nitrospinaceae bacterium]|jgi:hypothetical protein|nr:hypothetical protein [Nitrospinaceae bacterium]
MPNNLKQELENDWPVSFQFCFKFSGIQTHGESYLQGWREREQPADLADFFPHETVQAWVRQYFRKHPVTKSEDLETNMASMLGGLKACGRHINSKYDVRSLCGSVPDRLEEMKESGGDRLKH